MCVARCNTSFSLRVFFPPLQNSLQNLLHQGPASQTTPHLSTPIWGQIPISNDLQGTQTRMTNCHFKGVLRYKTLGKSLAINHGNHHVLYECSCLSYSFAYALIHIMYGKWYLQRQIEHAIQWLNCLNNINVCHLVPCMKDWAVNN